MQKILLADDERDVRALLQGELETAGYRVTAVGTGAEAVIAAADGGYDLYLLDMMMPGMNGVQTIQVLRKITPKIPILGLTGYTGQGYMAQASAYNVTCLAKPIDINDLLNEIKLKLANAARTTAPAAAGSTSSRFGRTS
ncbi:MAG: response regulator [Anaerolineales bacterium]|nr:response regulator [Anaerolineales bacterium]